MATSPERTRRLTLLIGVVAVLLLIVASVAFMGSCREPDGDPLEYVSPDEDLGPAPGVAE